MARRTIFLGSPLTTLVDTRGPSRPSWPDVGSDGVQLDAGAAAQLGDAVAFALAAETDWDLVRVWFAGVDQPELLVPGRVLFVPKGARVARLEPLFPSPSTRLYPAGGISKGVTSPLANGASANIAIAAGVGAGTFRNNAPSPAGDLVVQRWDGGKLTGAIAWPGGGSDLQDGASNWITLDADGTAGHTFRPADYSFDGQFSLADYVEAGLIAGAASGIARVSKFARDMHGNAGDPTAGTVLRYARYFQGSKLSAYGKMSPYFFARLALDVFDRMPVMEEGGSPYRPRLAPARYITFGAIAVAATPLAPAFPDQALLTFPVMNARRVELLFRNGGPGDLYVALVSPAVDDSIVGVAGVVNADPPPAAQYMAVTSGNEGSMVLDTPSHPYCKLLVGASAGGATIAAGAVLTVKRDVIE